MYTLSEQQIDFILCDIKSRGVEMEDLQVSLLDHVCCIIECELEPDGDFESFYRKTIPKFFKKELREIEEETLLLLTFKNYYAMRKTMNITGAISTVALIFGSFFKFMFWPGGNIMLLLGFIIACLIFMPLVFTLKARELKSSRDKIVLAVGIVFGFFISITTLFKVMHWFYGNAMLLISLGILFFIFIPVYFFLGIRDPEAKANTTTSSMIFMVAGGVLLTFFSIKLPLRVTINTMHTYVRSEMLLEAMQKRSGDLLKSSPVSTEINDDCRQIKELILQDEIGQKSIPKDFEERGVHFKDGILSDEFSDENGIGQKLISNLQAAVNKYNSSTSNNKIPVAHSILDINPNQIVQYSNFLLLNNIVQVQMNLVMAKSN
jgi:hypothetical protein